MLAGATTRRIFTEKVGIHRPFLARDSATTAQQQKEQYARIEKLVKNYLAEMNVDVRLYDDMLRVSPLFVRYLTEDELKAYGLQGVDPYYEQALHASKAEQLGISTEELHRRWNAARACEGNESWKCRDAIELGISREEYDRRDASARKVCAAFTGEYAEQLACYDRVIRGAEKE